MPTFSSSGPMPSFALSGTVLDSPDPIRLADFYQGLLGWDRVHEDPTWVTLRPDTGRPGLGFQLEADYAPPTWPSRPDEQQLQLHLDILVDDLDLAGARAVELGARLADTQFQDDVRVYLDPDGHPFCLFLEGA